MSKTVLANYFGGGGGVEERGAILKFFCDHLEILF